MSQIRIRPAALTDLPAVADLAHRVWHAYYPGIISVSQIDYMLDQRYRPDALAALLTAPSQRLDLLERNGILAGFDHYLDHDANTLKLDKLYLDPALHGKGLGRQLMAHVVGQATELGKHSLMLFVAKRNELARRFYDNAGFTVREAVEIDIGGGFVMDDFLMTKDIGQTASLQP